MTGSIPQLHRQHSSTATTHSTMEKTFRPKLRRCSSADDHSPLELCPTVNQKGKEIFSFKRASPTSEFDSGTEENEQQLEYVFLAPSSNDDEPIAQLDEGFSECEREEDLQLKKIKYDRKLHHHS